MSDVDIIIVTMTLQVILWFFTMMMLYLIWNTIYDKLEREFKYTQAQLSRLKEEIRK
jgi:phage shock protein PspC (stress-responsive transcriptional regulator)